MALAQIFKLADVIVPIKMLDARNAMYRVLERIGVNTTAWEPGAVVRSQLVAASAMFEALTGQQAEIARSGFLEYASGAWLRIKAKYDYNVIPEAASFATGTVTLTNAGGGIYSGGPGDLIVRNAVTGKAYRNVAGFDLASHGTVSVTIIALESGAASNANANAISEYVTEPYAGVTVANATALIARDAESAAEIKARCSEKLGSLSPFGPWDAYSYAARIAKLSTGESAGVTRTGVTRDGYGHVYLYVASASGPVGGSEGDTATPLGAVDESVQQNAAALGDTAVVLSATPVVITVSYRVWMRQSGMSADTVKETIAAALRVFMSTHPLGGIRLDDADSPGRVFAEAITSTIHAAVPEIYRVELAAPSGDTDLAPGDVPVLLHDPLAHAIVTTIASQGLLQ